MQKFSYENEFDVHENGPEGKTHFHKNSFARRLVLNMAAILLFWNTNMAAVTSRENALLPHHKLEVKRIF